MKILKFGGTSVGSPQAIEKVVEIITAKKTSESEPLAVVVSAFSGVTDLLRDTAIAASAHNQTYHELLERLIQKHIQAASALLPLRDHPRVLAATRETLNELEDAISGIFLLGELSKRSLDRVMSFGERLSAAIIAQALCSRGIGAIMVDARELIRTDDNFTNARLMAEETYQNIATFFLSQKSLAVITGFIGSTREGVPTTLGRGGSDYTAAIVGAALDASCIEIWTDVDGVMTADPRVVQTATVVPHLTYIESLELAHFGAKVIYPPTMLPALEKKIPIRIKNTFNPHSAGTLINGKSHPDDNPIKGIASLPSVALLRVEGSGLIGAIGSAARAFSALASKGVNVVFITQASSEYSICIGVHMADAVRARDAINEEFSYEQSLDRVKSVQSEYDCSIVTVVGEHMRKTPGVAGRLFATLGEQGISTVAIAQGSSEISISAVIESRREQLAVRAIHAAFFTSHTHPTIFVAGTGLIGGKLIEIIREHPVVRLCGVITTQSMLFDEQGVPQDQLTNGVPPSLEQFVQKIIAAKGPRKVFVDCTASEAIPLFYPLLLESGVSVVTPNKKGVSGNRELYQQCKRAEKQGKASFLYETTVGAALPVLLPLKDLIKTGDQIHSIRAVLSGTLSYIFNTFCSSVKTFSQVVREAHGLGYTEPDPRDDLSGLDVARKILILARECGSMQELADVSITPILPKESFDAESVDAFFATLESLDSAMDEKRALAQENGRVLRFIARMENGELSLGLTEVGGTDPFATLAGSDNMIVFKTARYCDTPLVVRGPGAGAAVTAAGVLADILKS